MCRRNKLVGSIFIAQGTGILLGCMIKSGFWCIMLAGILIAVGVMVLKQR